VHSGVFFIVCLLLQVSRKLLTTEESLEKAEAKLASSESYVPNITCLISWNIAHFCCVFFAIKCCL